MSRKYKIFPLTPAPSVASPPIATQPLEGKGGGGGYYELISPIISNVEEAPVRQGLTGFLYL